jgi:hypothetical protein
MKGVEIRAVKIFVAAAAEAGQSIPPPRPRPCCGAPARVEPLVTNN